ncbi:hypothetical protein PIB30_070027 [Stylosanthes scabra]|uniref:Uncharacterized protein n=1 Tax=Stylosanthes scabra TaxID=79078 RepID=A0ABU6XPP2_9FABA|nr:hypothetical protein [Stylosanthes scabra]
MFRQSWPSHPLSWRRNRVEVRIVTEQEGMAFPGAGAVGKGGGQGAPRMDSSWTAVEDSVKKHKAAVVGVALELGLKGVLKAQSKSTIDSVPKYYFGQLLGSIFFKRWNPIPY